MKNQISQQHHNWSMRKSATEGWIKWTVGLMDTIQLSFSSVWADGCLCGSTNRLSMVTMGRGFHRTSIILMIALKSMTKSSSSQSPRTSKVVWYRISSSASAINAWFPCKIISSYFWGSCTSMKLQTIAAHTKSPWACQARTEIFSSPGQAALRYLFFMRIEFIWYQI